ncbi:sperm microtubule associated protein 2 [Tenrec ecaudatus]|uniref:sperm microtubule associated protein 2 n=1 Tax=Tenrec ecaudatus TaxID=94439 RepID=UPI003F5AB13E
MGDHRQSLTHTENVGEEDIEADKAQDHEVLDAEGPGWEPQHLDHFQPELEDPEEEFSLEEVIREETPEAPNWEEDLSTQEGVPENQVEEDIPEVSQLSISRGWPESRGRKKRRRLFELARPKTCWQAMKDRVGCCQGFTWISPRKAILHFSLYWPSVYWTERFLEDTTLSITVPTVSPRMEELARPRRFYLEYYNNNRTTPIWPISRSSLDYQATNRLKELATPKIRNNIWSINMSEVSQVSKAAQMAIPSPRILQLAEPRSPATLLEEWDPMPKSKPHTSDYNRLLQLATPKTASEKCVPDRDPRWEVQESTKRAVASPRTLSLAQPKVRKEFNEGYDPYRISPASLKARASPRIAELATPKNSTRKM